MCVHSLRSSLPSYLMYSFHDCLEFVNKLSPRNVLRDCNCCAIAPVPEFPTRIDRDNFCTFTKPTNNNNLDFEKKYVAVITGSTTPVP